MIKQFFITIGLVGISSLGFSQSLSPTVIASAGNVISNGTVSLSWTLGELAVSTINSGANILTQGFHQPETSIPIGIKNIGITTSVSAFPNPVANELTLEINSGTTETFDVIIIDALGRQIAKNQFNATYGQTRHTMNISDFAPGTYLMKVNSTNGKFAKTLKITKI
jgi:hypothetical protein